MVRSLNSVQNAPYTRQQLSHGVLGKNRLTLMLVEQKPAKPLSISGRDFVLELGRNRFTGSGEALLADPRVRQLYLGG